VLTGSLTQDSPVARFVQLHGESVAVIALEVDDAEQAFIETTRRGATGVGQPKTYDNGTYKESAIRLYGDVILKFVERTSVIFAPGFEAVHTQEQHPKGYGLGAIDHIAGNVEQGAMNRWASFFADTMGFTNLIQFDGDDISTQYSALMSKVMQDTTGKIKFPINEPTEGLKKSQIQEYLDFHCGPGVQHIACATQNIIQTVTKLRESGVEFLCVPPSYYTDLKSCSSKIDEPIAVLQELGILVDHDEDGYLLQIFTKPVLDRPTLFFEIIERHGSSGFGQGNFIALFQAMEHEQALRGNL
jgi:4-hydroxyphenylpyruvate dioxygenase